jgi:hypothetical protein
VAGGIAPLCDAAWSLRNIASGQYAANVKFQMISCRPEKITVALMNFGRGPAFLIPPTFQPVRASLVDGLELSLHFDDAAFSESIALKPGESEIVHLIGWNRGAEMDLPRNNTPSECKYTFKWNIDDAYESKSKVLTCDCPSD